LNKGFLKSALARLDACAHLPAHGSASGSAMPAFDMHELHQLTGFPEVWAFEKRYAE
jgi:hypothetical protein